MNGYVSVVKAYQSGNNNRMSKLQMAGTLIYGYFTRWERSPLTFQELLRRYSSQRVRKQIDGDIGLFCSDFDTCLLYWLRGSVVRGCLDEIAMDRLIIESVILKNDWSHFHGSVDPKKLCKCTYNGCNRPLAIQQFQRDSTLHSLASTQAMTSAHMECASTHVAQSTLTDTQPITSDYVDFNALQAKLNVDPQSSSQMTSGYVDLNALTQASLDLDAVLPGDDVDFVYNIANGFIGPEPMDEDLANCLQDHDSLATVQQGMSCVQMAHVPGTEGVLTGIQVDNDCPFDTNDDLPSLSLQSCELPVDPMYPENVSPAVYCGAYTSLMTPRPCVNGAEGDDDDINNSVENMPSCSPDIRNFIDNSGVDDWGD